MTTFMDPMIISENLKAVGETETDIYKRHLSYRIRSKNRLEQ